MRLPERPFEKCGACGHPWIAHNPPTWQYPAPRVDDFGCDAWINPGAAPVDKRLCGCLEGPPPATEGQTKMPTTTDAFAVQVGKQRDELRDRLRALDHIADVNATAERDAAYAHDRERGGIILDPVDPTRVNLPVVWLRALLAVSRTQGYDLIADSAELSDLLTAWNTNYHGGTATFETLKRAHPELAQALATFTATL